MWAKVHLFTVARLRISEEFQVTGARRGVGGVWLECGAGLVREGLGSQAQMLGFYPGESLERALCRRCGEMN